ncbi:MAG: hypothetical protein ABSA69_05275 [Verrucomicrobiota bacterium]
MGGGAAGCGSPDACISRFNASSSALAFTAAGRGGVFFHGTMAGGGAGVGCSRTGRLVAAAGGI